LSFKIVYNKIVEKANNLDDGDKSSSVIAVI